MTGRMSYRIEVVDYGTMQTTKMKVYTIDEAMEIVRECAEEGGRVTMATVFERGIRKEHKK